MATATITCALMGNPNSGKTTLFNALTGSRQHVGNYPGVTVEKREGFVRQDGRAYHIIDLPGTYSLTAYSQDEVVARNVLVEDHPDGVIAVLDATTLERSLYLVLQVMELGLPVVLGLNMMDEVLRRRMSIDADKLSDVLGVPAVKMVARKGVDKKELLDVASRHFSSRKVPPLYISYGRELDPVLDEMSSYIEKQAFLTDRYPARWTALKYLENDAEIMLRGRERDASSHAWLEQIVSQTVARCWRTMNIYPEALVADARYGYIKALLKQGVLSVQEDSEVRGRFSDKVDTVVTNPLIGPLIMVGIVYLLFEITFALGQIPMDWLGGVFDWISGVVAGVLPAGLFRSLIVSGVIDGVGGVLGFVPLIMIMFFQLTLLEDIGYMARMAYMLDRVFRAFGLHGASVMPLIISGGIPGGCAVPGVMAARTLHSPKEKLATILVAPFMTCGAKVPVFLLLAAAFMPECGAKVLFWITIAGWLAALIVARVLRSTIIKGEAAPFVMELPPYRIPTLRGLCIHTWERAWQYIKKAGTVILAISILLWAAMTFPSLPQNRLDSYAVQRAEIKERTQLTRDAKKTALDTLKDKELAETLRYSLAGRIGTAIEPVTKWAGFDWRTNIALLGGFAAKEVVVSTLGTAYSLGDVEPDQSTSLAERLRDDPSWSIWTALSLIAFTILYAPCFVTVVTIARESSWKWAAFSVGMNTTVAFVVAVGIYQLGSLFS